MICLFLLILLKCYENKTITRHISVTVIFTECQTKEQILLRARQTRLLVDSISS